VKVLKDAEDGDENPKNIMNQRNTPIVRGANNCWQETEE